MKMKSSTYDKLKYALFIFVPALITLISGLGVALNFDTTLITTIIGLITTFIGSITGISNINYKKNGGE